MYDALQEEVREDEEDSEREGSCQGGCLLGGDKEDGSSEGMPQVKELKKLMLLVQQQSSQGKGRIACC